MRIPWSLARSQNKTMQTNKIPDTSPQPLSARSHAHAHTPHHKHQSHPHEYTHIHTHPDINPTLINTYQTSIPTLSTHTHFPLSAVLKLNPVLEFNYLDQADYLVQGWRSLFGEKELSCQAQGSSNGTRMPRRGWKGLGKEGLRNGTLA